MNQATQPTATELNTIIDFIQTHIDSATPTESDNQIGYDMYCLDLAEMYIDDVEYSLTGKITAYNHSDTLTDEFWGRKCTRTEVYRSMISIDDLKMYRLDESTGESIRININIDLIEKQLS